MDIKWRILENLVYYSYVVEYEMLELNPMVMIFLLVVSELRNFAYIFQPIYQYSSWGSQNSILYQYISGITLFYTFMNQEIIIIIIMVCSLLYTVIAIVSVYTLTFQADLNNSLTEKKEYLQKHIRHKAVSAYVQLLDIFLMNVIFTVVLVNFQNYSIPVSVICMCINLPIIILRLYIQNSVCFIIPNNFCQHRYDILDALILILNFMQIIIFSTQLQPYQIQYVISLIIAIIKLYSQLVRFNQLIPLFTSLIIIIQTITIVVSVGILITINIDLNESQFELITFIIAPFCIAFILQFYDTIKVKLLISSCINNKKVIFIISYTQSVRQNLIKSSQSIDTGIHILHLKQSHDNNKDSCKCSHQEQIKTILIEFGQYLNSSNNTSIYEQILSINVKLFLREYIQAYIHASQLIIGNKPSYTVHLITTRNYTMTEIFREEHFGSRSISLYHRIFLENIKLKCQMAVLKMLNMNWMKSDLQINIQSIVQGDTIKLQIQNLIKEALQQKISFLNALVNDRMKFESGYEKAISKILLCQHQIYNITKTFANQAYQACYIFFLAEIIQDVQAAYQKSRQQVQRFQQYFREDDMIFFLCEMVDQSYQLQIVRYSHRTLSFFGVSRIPELIAPFIPTAIRDYHPQLLEKFLSNGNINVYKQISRYYAQLPSNLIVSADAYLDILFSNDSLQFLIIFYPRSDPEVTIILNSDQFIKGVNQQFLTELEIDQEYLNLIYELPINVFIKNFKTLKDSHETHQVSIDIPKFHKHYKNIYRYSGFLLTEIRKDDSGNPQYYILNIHGLFKTFHSMISYGKDSTKNDTDSIVLYNLGKEEQVISPLDFDEDIIISPRDSVIKKTLLPINTMQRHLSQQDFIHSQALVQSKNQMSQQSSRLQKDKNIQESSIFSMVNLIQSQFQKKYDLINKIATKTLNNNLYKSASSFLVMACLIQIIALIILMASQYTEFQNSKKNFDVLRIKLIVIQPIVQCQLLRFQIYNYKVLLGAKLINQTQFTDATSFAYNNLEYVQNNFQTSIEQLTLNYYFTQKAANVYIIAQYDATNTSIAQNYTYRNFINTLTELQQQMTDVYASGSVPNPVMPYAQYYYKNYLMIHQDTNNLKIGLYSNLKNIFAQMQEWQTQYIIIFYIFTLLFTAVSAFIFTLAKKKRLEILANLISPDISLYKSELKHYNQLLDSLENMNTQKYLFNLDIKEKQIKAYKPTNENQLISISKVKLNITLPQIIIGYGILYIIVISGLLIATIYVLEFAQKASNTADFSYIYNDLVYYTGSVYVQRDIIYVNPITGLLTASLVQQYLSEIRQGLTFIQDYSSTPPSTNNLLLSQEFLDANFNLTQQNLCSIDLPGVLGYKSICETAFSGILTQGLTQILSNIFTSLRQEISLNNFTSRQVSPSIDLPGAFILSEYLNNINKAMFVEIHEETNNYYNNILLVSALYIVFLAFLIGFIIYLFIHRFSSNMQKSLYFIYFMPMRILFYDDSFERKVRGTILHNDQI